MFFLRLTIRLILLITLTFSSVVPMVHANNLLQRQPGATGDDSLGELGQDVAESLVDEVVFDNLNRLAGPACNLYGLGVDLVNFVYDGQWPLYASLLEISVLFRNESWRELIWALNDQRDAFLDQLVRLKKRRCVVAFGLPQAWSQGDVQTRQRGQEMQRLDRQIIELEAKIDYFKLQQRNIFLDGPTFEDTLQFDPNSYRFPALATDKIFYWLFTPPALNWEQIKRDSYQYGLRTYEDVAVVAENLPDTCFAAANLGHELGLYFLYAYENKQGVYTDADGKTYRSFREFVQQNAAAITQEYADFCRVAQKGTIPTAPETSVEQQYAQLRASLENFLQQVSRSLSGIRSQISVLETRRDAVGELDNDEAEQLLELQKENGKRQAMIEYYSLVLSKVGSPASQSLTNLSRELSELTEAILGVMRDNDGKLVSRLSFAERFEASKARQLQQICGRIEAMYRKAGRSTADLPIIGSADGKVYCRASPDCADVDLTNFTGGSEGARKLWECSGFLFNSSELGPSQQTQRQFEQVGEDVGYLLQQRSLNELLTLRDLHFVSLRERYAATYGTMDASTAQLDRILQDVKTDLCGNPTSANQGELCGEGIFDPQRTSPKTHLSVMKKVYQDFWKFMDQQEGSCPAPQDPEI
ncbi:MAG: hypothetical protein AB7J40_05435 [Candidatus Altimarinota bacterium]